MLLFHALHLVKASQPLSELLLLVFEVIRTLSQPARSPKIIFVKFVSVLPRLVEEVLEILRA